MNKIYKYTFLIIALLTVVPALAQTDPMVTETDNLWMKKTVKDNENGTYTLNLQTYVRGTGQITKSIRPCDIALVLDFSSSMNSNKLTSKTTEIKEALPVGTTISTDRTYKIVINNNEYYLKCFKNNNKYYYRYNKDAAPTAYNRGTQLGSSSYSSLQAVASSGAFSNIYFYQAAEEKEMSRLEALKAAVCQFIKTVYENSPTEANQYHKISIIPFSSGNATVIKQHFTDVNSSTYVGMMDNVVSMNYDTGTRADKGLELAIQEFNNNGREGTPKIVVFFTDGVPTRSGSAATDFNVHMGAKAVQYAYTLKQNDVKIFSVALFKSNYETIYIRRYLNFTSSNYPDKTFDKLPDSSSQDSEGNPVTTISEDNSYFNYGVMNDGSDGAEAAHDYYKLSTGSDLSEIFADIAESASTSGEAFAEISSTSAVVLDALTNKFKLPANTKAKDINVYTCSVDEESTETDIDNVPWKKDGSGKEVWDEWKPWAATGSTKTIDDFIRITRSGSEDTSITGVEAEGDMLEVTGYDFATYYVGPVKDESDNVVGWHGQKLIIEFIIETDPANVGGLSMITNDGISGLYGKDKNGNYIVVKDGEQEAKYKQPTVNLPYIKIIKKGLKVGESALFRVTKVTEAYSNVAVTDGTAYTADVIITRATESQNDDNAPYAILKLVYTGDYKVEELPWAWAYTHQGPKWGHLSTVEATSDTKFLEFTFTNSTNSDAPEHAESFVPNNMSVSRRVGDPKTGSTEGGSSDDETGGDDGETDFGN